MSFFLSFFFFNDTATTEIYTLSLHDALPNSPTSSSTWRRNDRRLPLPHVPLAVARRGHLPTLRRRPWRGHAPRRASLGTARGRAGCPVRRRPPGRGPLAGA